MKLSLLSTLLALFVGNALAADAADNLLPVEQAFKVQAKAVDRGAVQFDFKIADDYYLYRERVKVKSNDANVTLGALDMPAGEKKHDEFLGDVEVFHHGFSATQHFTAPADGSKISIELRYQGCHQVEPKICFPPQKINLSIDLPKAANAALGDVPTISLGGGSSSLLNNGPLPQEQGDNDVARPHGGEGVHGHAQHVRRPDLAIRHAGVAQHMQQELEPQGPQQQRGDPHRQHQAEVGRRRLDDAALEGGPVQPGQCPRRAEAENCKNDEPNG